MRSSMMEDQIFRELMLEAPVSQLVVWDTLLLEAWRESTSLREKTLLQNQEDTDQDTDAA